jgi:hypothetical protein
MLTGPDTGRGELCGDEVAVRGGTEVLGVDEAGADVVGAGEGEPVGDASLHPTSPTDNTTKLASLT